MRLTAIGILLAPAAAATVWATLHTLGPVLGKFDVTFPLLAGALVFSLPYTASLLSGGGNRASNRFYIIAHELTHALAAFLSGVKVRKIAVRGRSGYVLTDSTNTFISLAPYFIPLYTLAAALAYWIAGRFCDISPLRPWFLAAAGFTLTFHILHTADILSGPVQSDLKKAGGALFSIPVVLLLNCAGLAIALKLMFPELLSLKAWLAQVLRSLKVFYSAIFSAAAYIYNTAKIYINT